MQHTVSPLTGYSTSCNPMQTSYESWSFPSFNTCSDIKSEFAQYRIEELKIKSPISRKESHNNNICEPKSQEAYAAAHSKN